MSFPFSLFANKIPSAYSFQQWDQAGSSDLHENLWRQKCSEDLEPVG